MEMMIVESAARQEDAISELSDLSYRVELLSCAMRGTEKELSFGASLTAVEDIQKSVDEAILLVERIGLSLLEAEKPGPATEVARLPRQH